MADPPDILRQALSRAESVYVRNILNPLLWLNAVSVPSCLGGAYLLRDHLVLAGPTLAIGLLTPVATLVAYAYFSVRDPDRLQSEEFRIAQQQLLVREKGRAPEPVEAVLVGDDTPPSAPLILESRDEG